MNWQQREYLPARTISTALAFFLMAWQVEAGQGPEETDEVKQLFSYEERSTVNTIPFESMGQEALSDTVIDGGLEQPAPGVRTRAHPSGGGDHYLDPLAQTPNDGLSNAEKGQIPVEVIYSVPKKVPGQTFGNNYVIRPPENRTYEALNTNLTERP